MAENAVYQISLHGYRNIFLPDRYNLIREALIMIIVNEYINI